MRKDKEKRADKKIRAVWKNEQGDMTVFTCFFILITVMLVSYLLLYASVQITCINIRNGAKLELNNLSGSIYADTYRSQREVNFSEYLSTINSIPL